MQTKPVVQHEQTNCSGTQEHGAQKALNVYSWNDLKILGVQYKDKLLKYWFSLEK